VGHMAEMLSGWRCSVRGLRGDRHLLVVVGVLGATMTLLLSASGDALAGLLGGEEDRAETALSRPECLPDEMPLPTGATFVFALPTASGDMAAYVYVRRPVAEVIADLEGRLAEEGWTVVAEQSAVVWPDDLRFRVVRRGQTWTVHMEPSVGSATETNVIYAPV